MFRLAVPLVLIYGTLLLTSVHAETTFIPAAVVSGAYESNVWYRPSQFLPPGTQLHDFRSTVGGAVTMLHDTRDIEARVTAGGNFNAYVENTALNYFSGALNGQVILDRWVDQYFRGAHLSLKENFLYTPATPGFARGIRERGEDDTFLRGIEGFRANTYTNTTAVIGSYPLSRDVKLEGGYTFALRRYGRIRGLGDDAQVRFFDTNAHTWFGGPRYQLTRNDSIAVLYRQSFLSQSSAEGGRTFNTNFVSLLGDYTKTFPEWSFTVEGGVTFIQPGHPSSRTLPVASLQVTTHPERDTVLILTVSRQARPVYFLAGGATISNVGRIGISHRIYERLTLEGSTAYAYNEYFPDTGRTFKSFHASSSLHYKVTRNITGSFLYDYTFLDVDRSSIQYQYGRHSVGLMLTAEWK